MEVWNGPERRFPRTGESAHILCVARIADLALSTCASSRRDRERERYSVLDDGPTGETEGPTVYQRDRLVSGMDL